MSASTASLSRPRHLSPGPTVRIALMDALVRWRRDLGTAERHLQDAIEADAGEQIEWHTQAIAELRASIRDVAEFLEAL